MNVSQIIKQTIEDYHLFSRGDKIVVALSGGKDSAVVAWVLHKLGYNIEALHVDLKIGKYSEACLEKVNELCSELEIPLHLFDIKEEMGASMCYLRTSIQSRKNTRLRNCAICGVIKKWIFNKKARELKADKMASWIVSK